MAVNNQIEGTVPTFAQAAKLPGIADLAITIRGPFAKAYRAELLGDQVLAEAELAKAVAAQDACEAAGTPVIVK